MLMVSFDSVNFEALLITIFAFITLVFPYQKHNLNVFHMNKNIALWFLSAFCFIIINFELNVDNPLIADEVSSSAPLLQHSMQLEPFYYMVLACVLQLWRYFFCSLQLLPYLFHSLLLLTRIPFLPLSLLSL